MSQFSVFQAQNQAAITNWLLGNVFKDDLNNPNARYGGDVPPPIGGVTVAFDEAAYVTMEGTDAEVTLDFGNTTAGAIEDTVTITVYDGAVEVNAYTFDNVDVAQGASSIIFEFGDDLAAGEYTMVADFFGSSSQPQVVTLTVTDAPVTDYVVIPVTSADDLTTLNADTIRTTAGKDYVYFDFDFTGLGAGAAVNIANFADGDKLITGYPIDDTGLFIEGLTTDIAVAFGPNMTTFVGSWIANLEDQPAALLAEVQGTADLDTQINLIGAEYGAGWVVEALPA